MRLRKPPVIEAWIGFVFEANPAKRSWDLEAAWRLLDRYKETLQHLEAVQSLALQVKKVSPNVRAEVVREQAAIVSIRAHNTEQDRWLQLADDRLVYNLVLPGEKHPGFAKLLEEAMHKFDDYVAIFSPQSVKDAEIHYVDVVEIPCAAGEPLVLTDYFHLTTDLPDDPWGQTGEFSTQFTLVVQPQPDIFQVRIQSLPDSSPNCLRVRIDWHRVCRNIGSLDQRLIKERMELAHSHLLKCFRASVTDKTWMLFEPIADEAHGNGSV